MAHPIEIKRDIVDLLNKGIKASRISKDYGIPESTIKHFPGELARKAKIEAEYRAAKESVASSVRTSPSPKKEGVFSVTTEIVGNEQSGKQRDSHVVLAIPDLHCPFHHQDALAFLIAVRDKIKPDKVVCLGDEVDFHAYSKWPKDPDGMGPGQELKAAIEALIPFYVAFPEVQVCVSNHTIRPVKQMKMMGLPQAFFPQYTTMLNAPDLWTWHEHIIIDNVRYIHGDQGKGGQHGWTQNSVVYHQSTVVGHWHSKAGVYYDSDMFNVNAGCLIDAEAYAFGYAKNSHKRPNLGCAIISHGRKAAFLPMLLDSKGRWIGEL